MRKIVYYVASLSRGSQVVKLFGNSSKKYGLQLIDTQDYENGLQIMTYRIDYGQ